MMSMRAMLRASLIGGCILGGTMVSGCASSVPYQDADSEAGDSPPATWEEETRDAVESLRRAVEASYDRERALAERLRQTEEQNAVLMQEVKELKARSASIGARFDGLGESGGGTSQVSVRSDREEQVLKVYQQALAQYKDREYHAAVEGFGAILSSAPYSQWADNAQYWRGECLYGLGQYRQALTEFTKVFAYKKTEKDDDAQLKVARCYLALGEKGKALAAFQKLLEEFPDSEYTDVTRKEIRYLEGQ